MSLGGADPSAIGPYGLIQALPVGYFVGLGIVLVSFPFIWCAGRPSRLEFPIAVAAQVILLHGAQAIVEPLPRFASAWLLAGFTDFVTTHGQVLPLVDARFSWPSMFSGVAILARAGGLPTAIALLRWWPVAIDLLCLPAVYLIARKVLRDPKRAMLAVWLFPIANWVGQDYYSPQSVAFFLYLVLIVIVLAPFGARTRTFWRKAPGGPAGGPDGDETSDPGTTDLRNVLVLLICLLVLTVAIATGHQLTPFFAALTALALSLAGRTKLRVFVILMGVIAVGWVSFAAFAFWAGHMAKVFGQFGEVGGNVSSTVTSRLGGSDAHHFVTRVRLLTAVSIWGLGAAGAVLGRRVGADRLSAVILMLTPFAILGAQDYGGEGGLRVYLISLPGVLCLIAILFTAIGARKEASHPPGSGGAFRPRAIHAAPVLLLTILLVPMFLVARWGNELFEQTRPNEIAAIEALYDMAPPGATLLALNSHIPWRYRAVDGYVYRDSADEVAFENPFKSNPLGGFVIVTTGQIDFGVENYGLPADWAQEAEALITSSERFTLVYENPDARIYRYQG